MTGPFVEDDREDDEVLRDWATELGVSTEVMRRLVEQRRELLHEVALDPRAFGFDLLPRGGSRRDVVAEFRSRTRTQGALAESFLTGSDALLKSTPRPLTLPDGSPLDRHLVQAAGLAPDAAAAIADHLRSTLQARLGRPLETDHVEHSVREAAWDHELDAARVTPEVLRALAPVL